MYGMYESDGGIRIVSGSWWVTLAVVVFNIFFWR